MDEKEAEKSVHLEMRNSVVTSTANSILMIFLLSIASVYEFMKRLHV